MKANIEYVVAITMDTHARMFKKALQNPEKILPHLLDNSKKNLLNIYRNMSICYNSRSSIGENVFECDWDTLIILDSCRVDALKEVAPEYDFLSDIESYYSIGGQSAEWIAKTFDQDHSNIINQTAYISANPHSKTVLRNKLAENWDSSSHSEINRLRRYGKWRFVNPNEFATFDELWQYNNDQYQYPPRFVTDQAIRLSRENDYGRMILHYMPPHTPYHNETIPEDSDLASYSGTSFNYLKETGDRETVYQAYLNMLRWVLDDIKLLLDNLDSDRVAITADHGEAFGEYGIYFHHAGSLHPYIRNVPWAITTARDSESYTPSFSRASFNNTSTSVEESLKDLGYL